MAAAATEIAAPPTGRQLTACMRAASTSPWHASSAARASASGSPAVMSSAMAKMHGWKGGGSSPEDDQTMAEAAFERPFSTNGHHIPLRQGHARQQDLCSRLVGCARKNSQWPSQAESMYFRFLQPDLCHAGSAARTRRASRRPAAAPTASAAPLPPPLCGFSPQPHATPPAAAACDGRQLS